MRILVNPDQLRALSAQLQQVAGDLQGVESRVSGALGGLDWEARQKVGVEGQVGNARNQARALAAQAEEISRYLASKAQAFEEADGQGAASLPRVPRPSFPLPVPLPPRLPWPFPTIPIIFLPFIPLLPIILWPPRIIIRPPRISLPPWFPVPKPGPRPTPTPTPSPGPTPVPHLPKNGDKIKKVIEGLKVESTPRYLPEGGKTYCNIFAMDYAKSMG
ncbi:MAG: hypothetical protein DRG71_06480, partial [Deltaproteobacteria bacterium]